MAKLIKRSPVPVDGAAVVWLIWGLFLPLYTLPHFLLAAAVSVAVFLVAKRLCPNRTILLPDPEPEPEPTGNPEIDALVAERDRALAEMRRLNDAIEDPAISAQIDHLEEITRKIIAHVVENPQKLPQIRRFMNYYLPTTLKLLNAYDRMDEAGVAGANIDGTMGRIETMMGAIVTAFDRQLDALFGDVALDISTDITVMEQLLAREGLSDPITGGRRNFNQTGGSSS